MNQSILVRILPLCLALLAAACSASSQTLSGEPVQTDLQPATTLLQSTPTATPRAESTTPTPSMVPSATVTLPPTIGQATETQPTNEEPTVTPQGPSPEQQRLLSGLEAKGLAPEVSSETWLNTQPLEWENLRGKVVIVEFWTYG